MTTTSARREQIAASLLDKEYRDLFVTEEIDTGLPFQIRAIRQDRGWSQQELAERVGMTQEAISRLENLNYCKFTLGTLKRLASAFDVALVVRFEPFSRLVDWASNLSPDDLIVPDFTHDASLRQTPSDEGSLIAGAGSGFDNGTSDAERNGQPVLVRSSFKEQNGSVEGMPDDMARDWKEDHHIAHRSFRIVDLVSDTFLIAGRTFEDCTIAGPAVLRLVGEMTFEDDTFESAMDAMLWDHPDEKTEVAGAIDLIDCTFRRCVFRGIGFTGERDIIAVVRRSVLVQS